MSNPLGPQFPQFAPRFILESELSNFGLPSVADQPDILTLIEFASLAIDAACGRVDTDGSGSLVYTTYEERKLIQAQGRNILYLSNRPLVGINEDYRSTLEGYAVSGVPGSGTTPVPITPQGSINGTNTVFTLPITSTRTLSIMLFLGGVFQTQGVDYTLAGVTITYATAPSYGLAQVALVIYGDGTPETETPNGTIDGSNTEFSLVETPSTPASLLLFLSGVFQTQGVDYTLTANTIRYTVAPQAGSHHLAVLVSGLDSLDENFVYTGFKSSTTTTLSGTPHAIVGASGRYGYTRRDAGLGYADPGSIINPMSIISLLGGPPVWVPIDPTLIDYDPKTGELWVPAGLDLTRYSEIFFVYTSGFDPLRLPRTLKQACAAAVKNLLGKAGGTTGLTRISLGKSGAQAMLVEQVLDSNITEMLTPFMNMTVE